MKFGPKIFSHKNTHELHEAVRHSQQNLFLRLDENYKKYYEDRSCWKDLHALDAELVPGSIHVEPFAHGTAKNIFAPDGIEDQFYGEEPTLVFGLKSRDAAIRAAHLLGRIFIGCGTKFIPEVVHKEGKDHFQVRSNIDKQHWDKLCVFCHYRFNRETISSEQEALQQSCQQTVDAYTTNDEVNAGWEALEGVPAFITLMGLHGILRPMERHPFNKKEAKKHEIEFNKASARGTPYAFSGIECHIEMRTQSGDAVTVTPYPHAYEYTYGFEPTKAALRDALDNKSYWEFLLKSFGGDPFDKDISLKLRCMEIMGLFLGLYGLKNFTEDAVVWAGPTTIAGIATSFVIATYLENRYKILDKLGKRASGQDKPGVAQESILTLDLPGKGENPDIQLTIATPAEGAFDPDEITVTVTQKPNHFNEAVQAGEDSYEPTTMVIAVKHLHQLQLPPREADRNTVAKP